MAADSNTGLEEQQSDAELETLSPAELSQKIQEISPNNFERAFDDFPDILPDLSPEDVQDILKQREGHNTNDFGPESSVQSTKEGFKAKQNELSGAGGNYGGLGNEDNNDETPEQRRRKKQSDATVFMATQAAAIAEAQEALNTALADREAAQQRLARAQEVLAEIYVEYQGTAGTGREKYAAETEGYAKLGNDVIYKDEKGYYMLSGGMDGIERFDITGTKELADIEKELHSGKKLGDAHAQDAFHNLTEEINKTLKKHDTGTDVHKEAEQDVAEKNKAVEAAENRLAAINGNNPETTKTGEIESKTALQEHLTHDMKIKSQEQQLKEMAKSNPDGTITLKNVDDFARNNPDVSMEKIAVLLEENGLALSTGTDSSLQTKYAPLMNNDSIVKTPDYERDDVAANYDGLNRMGPDNKPESESKQPDNLEKLQAEKLRQDAVKIAAAKPEDPQNQPGGPAPGGPAV